MQQELPDILATRLNFDVIAFRGNTRHEMMRIAMVSLLSTALTLGLLCKCWFGFFLVGVGLSFPIAIPIGWMVATLFQKLKAGKPKGYLTQATLIWLDTHQLKPAPFVRYSGPWCLRRQ